MTWLVVGAHGQLGRSLVDDLNHRHVDFMEWNRRQGSVLDLDFVVGYVSQIHPKVIVNCAAWTDVDGAESNEAGARLINADAVGYLAQAAKGVGAVFAHISTDYVFSGSSNEPWVVAELRAPETAYGRTKALGEDYITEKYPNGSYIFRTAWLYSSYGKNFAKTMTRLALNQESEVSVVNDQIGQPTSAGDLASQIVDSILKEIPIGIYHATNGGEASWFEFAQEIFRLADVDFSRVVPVRSDAHPRSAKRPSYSVLDHSKWAETSVNAMRDWKIALADSMPTIIAAVRAEG